MVKMNILQTDESGENCVKLQFNKLHDAIDFAEIILETADPTTGVYISEEGGK